MKHHPARARMAEIGIRTETELARLVQTYPSAISGWLIGDRGLSKENARRIATILRVSLETVLFDWQIKRPGETRWERTRRKKGAGE